MPFFYVPGNHDTGAAEAAKVWKERLGRNYYHFVYRNVLFLLLDSDDQTAAPGSLGKDQVAYARKAVADNPGVRWTIVAVHRPLWTLKDGTTNGWAEVEQALAGRRYTVFCGHIHEYRKYVRNGQNHYQLATTGGVSLMRGIEHGEFDHIVWVTMKNDGPVLANILVDSIHNESLQKIVTNEPVETKRKPTFPVRGKAFFEGSPIPGAQVYLQVAEDAKTKGIKAVGIVAADGSFRLSTYRAHDGAAEGEYSVTILWKQPAYDVQGKVGPNLLPSRYALSSTSGLRATIKPGDNELVLELSR
jgi:hypothetical protein